MFGSHRVGIAQQQPELLATQPPDHIGAAQPLPQHPAQVLQGKVSRFVAPAVIDLLEMIDIQQHQGKLVAAALTLLDALGKQLMKTGAIEYTGQSIHFRHALQRLLRHRAPALIKVHEQQNHQAADHRVADIDQPGSRFRVGIAPQIKQQGRDHERDRQQQSGTAPQQQIGEHRHHIHPDERGDRRLGHQHDIELKAEGRQQVAVDPGRQPADPHDCAGRPQQEQANDDFQRCQHGIVIAKLQQRKAAEYDASAGKDKTQQ